MSYPRRPHYISKSNVEAETARPHPHRINMSDMEAETSHPHTTTRRPIPPNIPRPRSPPPLLQITIMVIGKLIVQSPSAFISHISSLPSSLLELLFFHIAHYCGNYGYPTFVKLVESVPNVVIPTSAWIIAIKQNKVYQVVIPLIYLLSFFLHFNLCLLIHFICRLSTNFPQ
jgi:hypothetical protein